MAQRYWRRIVTYDKKKRQNLILIGMNHPEFRIEIFGDHLTFYVYEWEFKDILGKVGLPYIKKGER